MEFSQGLANGAKGEGHRG